MDILILAAGLSTRLSNYTHNLIPKYLINIDDHTGLYYLIKYWNTYAKNIYLVIHTKYNEITNFYIQYMLPDYIEKIKIINYDYSDGTAYTLNHILNNNLKKKKIKHLIITWCDLYPCENIDFKKINHKNKEKSNNIYIFTYGNQCRFELNKSMKIIPCPENNGNIIGIYYFQNYQKFVLENNSINNDIVSYLDIIGNLNEYPLKNIIDYGDEQKLLHIFKQKKDNNLICRYFNSIEIIDDKLLKKGVNDKGKEIIIFEKEWYNYINKLEKKFTFIPKIYQIFEYGYLMDYKKDHIPLYKYINNRIQNQDQNQDQNDIIIKNTIFNIEKITILKNIIDKLNILHNIEKKSVSKIIFFNDIKKEIYDKVIDRKKIIDPILNYFGNITTVNNLKILSFDDVINKCKNIITKYYELINNYQYSIIFGDCQFSNILIHKEYIHDILFIDPRGYFGNTKIYGPVEYDYAKLLYAISGYDSFNNNLFNLISIKDGHIEFKIESIINDKIILKQYFNKVHNAFLVVIWLSLAEYNKNNIWKCIASYYYGLYLGTIL